MENSHEIRGRVEHVIVEKRCAFIKPTMKLPPEVKTSDRGTFFLQLSESMVTPQPGATGTFLVVPGDERGWRVKRVVRWDSTPEGVIAATGPVERFVHPYNFVSLPSVELHDQQTDVTVPSKPGPVNDHSRFEPKLYTGAITCSLKTLGPWFIPDPRKAKAHVDDHDHKILGYFSLEEAKNWRDKFAPHKDGSTPAIPGSSLRGMVRGVFEAATLSCLNVFDPSPLEYRLGRDIEEVKHSHQQDESPNARYVPCRIVRIDQSGAVIELLDGRQADDNLRKVTVLRCALIHAYRPKVLNPFPKPKGSSGTITEIWRDLITLPNGKPWRGNRVAAVITATPHPLNQANDERFHVREVLAAVRADADELTVDDETILRSALDGPTNQGMQPHLVFGYLHRTGPNVENKHHERIFFRWGNFNDLNDGRSIKERFKDFVSDAATAEHLNDRTRPYIPIGNELLEKANSQLRAYAERQPGKDAAALEKLGSFPPRVISDSSHQPNVLPPYPSDFVLGNAKNIGWKENDTGYVLLKGDGADAQVEGMYAVALPRWRHESTRGDLLPYRFFPCSSKHQRCRECNLLKQKEGGEMCNECLNRHQFLCPACRVFGWCRDGKGEFLKPHAKRIDNVAGHVRFTHGIYQSGDFSAQAIPLAILGSPKPTTTLFYLKTTSSFTKAKQDRCPSALQRVPYALYRRSEAQLRGRKFYRRRTDPSTLNDPRAGGIKRHSGIQDGQNRTAFVLPKDLVFSFTVHFDNLSKAELGALVFSLLLKNPESWKMTIPDSETAKKSHMIGLGKPLGMGACQIEIQNLLIDCDPESPNPGRYGSWNSQPVKTSVDSVLDAFGESWIQSNPGGLDSLKDLLEMLRYDWPHNDQPSFHYPPVDGTGRNAFRWWENAKKKNLRLPLPSVERSNADQRLPERID